MCPDQELNPQLLVHAIILQPMELPGQRGPEVLLVTCMLVIDEFDQNVLVIVKEK